MTCSHCTLPAKAKGLCAAHYMRTWRYGNPFHETRKTLSAESLFWAKVMQSGDCWLWTGGLGSSGYGQVGKSPAPSGTKLAHRAAWEMLRGEIPDGLHVDHLCRIRRCVNPWHMEPVTVAENTARGLHGAMRTECKNGHALTPDNTYVRPGDNSRRCRECIRREARDRARAQRATERAQDTLHSQNLGGQS